MVNLGPTPLSGRTAVSPVQPNHAEASAGSSPRLWRADPRNWGLILRNSANRVEIRLHVNEGDLAKPSAPSAWLATKARRNKRDPGAQSLTTAAPTTASLMCWGPGSGRSGNWAFHLRNRKVCSVRAVGPPVLRVTTRLVRVHNNINLLLKMLWARRVVPCKTFKQAEVCIRAQPVSERGDGERRADGARAVCNYYCYLARDERGRCRTRPSPAPVPIATNRSD